MSEGNSYWVVLAERLVGIFLIIISAVMLYFTATTASLDVYSWLFTVLGVVVLIVGIFLLLVRPRE
jgi:hypothetical protein